MTYTEAIIIFLVVIVFPVSVAIWGYHDINKLDKDK